jgi:predicted nuclease with TOPRIM domain
MRIDQTKKGDVGEVEAKGRPWAHRIRKLETELRQKEQEIIAMRARLSTVNGPSGWTKVQ